MTTSTAFPKTSSFCIFLRMLISQRNQLYVYITHFVWDIILIRFVHLSVHILVIFFLLDHGQFWRVGMSTLVLVCSKIVHDVICKVVVHVNYIDLVNLCMIFRIMIRLLFLRRFKIASIMILLLSIFTLLLRFLLAISFLQVHVLAFVLSFLRRGMYVLLFI